MFRSMLLQPQESYRQRSLPPKVYCSIRTTRIGRGITVCERWLNSFESFAEDMGVRPSGTSIERLNNSEGYSPTNCVWASRQKQQRNTRRNKLITFEGATRCISEWAEIVGMNQETLRQRIFHQGWSIRDALYNPVGTLPGEQMLEEAVNKAKV